MPNFKYLITILKIKIKFVKREITYIKIIIIFIILIQVQIVTSKKKNKNFIRALSCSPNKILAQFLNQYESINCKTAKYTFRKNLSIKSISPSSAQNRFNNKRIRNLINKGKNRRNNKDLDYIIKKGEDLKNRMKNLLYNYISLSSEIKKRYIKTEFK